ncbi:MAG TPA: cytochrome c biogenesis protein CcdA [Chthonomonadales bacterium]|nr:cytochrome c biogenesis protein CcdA [Chthonomonadales bacterium]
MRVAVRAAGWVAAAGALLLAMPAMAQLFQRETVRLSASIVGPPSANAARLRVMLRIEPGYHIQANTAKAPYIATTLSIRAPRGVTVGRPSFPASKPFRFAGETIQVFSGDVPVFVPLALPANRTGPIRLEITVGYQACDDDTCFPPSEEKLTFTIPPPARPMRRADAGPATDAGPDLILAAGASEPGAGAPPTAGSGDVIESGPLTGYRVSRVEQFVAPEPFVRFLETGDTGAGGAGRLEGLLDRGNLALALPLIFLLGLALNLTPCVYPIIPLTMSYFGGQAGQAGTRPVHLAIVYVLGMALMYSVLGVAAGLTGALFGAQLQNPWLLAFFALIMFALALSQFDRRNGQPIWEFQLPAALRSRVKRRSGYMGAALMGMLVGVIAAPCIGPAVVALLQWVGSQQSPGLGFLTFFTLALGLGLPYVFLATATGSMKRMPRSGDWMVGVKHLFGLVMVWMGFFYLETVLSLLRPGLGAWVLVGVTALCGVFALLDRSGAKSRAFVAFRRTAGVAAIALAVWMALPKPAETIRWEPYTAESAAAARETGRPILVDFTAAWCAACKQLERETFSDPRVGAAARRFVALRGDMTNFGGPESLEWRTNYSIQGLPTVLRLLPPER